MSFLWAFVLEAEGAHHVIFTAWAPVGSEMRGFGKPIHLHSPRVLHKTPPATQSTLCLLVGAALVCLQPLFSTIFI